MRDKRLALLWHVIEFLVVVLLALSIVGLGWSIDHARPRFQETHRPER